MNESSAREVALLRAIETTDREQRLLGADDRVRANRSAREWARRQVADGSAAAAAEPFLRKRSGALLDVLTERHPALAALRRPAHWPLWIGIVAPVAAFFVGAVAERIVNPQRVDLLSGALLLIVLWNLLVYLGLLLWPLLSHALPTGRTGASVVAPPPVARWLAHWFGSGREAAKTDSKLGGDLGAAVLAFGRDWARISAPLTAARAARIMHLSAAMFAIGAIGSLYLRGIVSEYRIGWESTFLGGDQVHALLSFVFWPVVKLFEMQPFTAQEVAALQFSQPPQPESGARWVHLYAALLALVVVVPRLLLAGFAAASERRLARSLAPDLGDPYFRRLLAGIAASGRGAVLRVLPYSFTVDEARAQSLREVAAQLLGDDARLALGPSLAYGAEPDTIDAPSPSAAPDENFEPGAAGTGSRAAALTLVLFNLAATPEQENHGAFIDHVRAAAPRRIGVLIDESSLAERLGSAPHRMAQRRELWRHFCELHGVVAIAFVDLLQPSLSGIEHDLGPRVAAAAA
ncbi:MAG: DUF2868 domain-containing protein [Burkholderiales bacterium]